MKKITILLLYVFLGFVTIAQSFDYMSALQTYWKYRYR